MKDLSSATDGTGLPEEARLRAHHEWFRRLVKDQVEATLRFGVVRRSDWVLQCYRSIEEFETRFPNPDEREGALRLMESRYARLAGEIEDVRDRYSTEPGRGGR